MLTAAEKTFMARMAFHVEAGLSFEDAAKAVIADDRKIADFVFDDSKRGKAVQSALAAEVYYRLKRDAAINKALDIYEPYDPF